MDSNSTLVHNSSSGSSHKTAAAEKILTSFRVNYSSQFNRRFPSEVLVDGAIVAYARQLEGYTRDQVRRAIDRLLNSEWMPDPSDLGKTLRAIKIEDVGVPKIEDAWETAHEIWIHHKLAYKDAHPMFYHMAHHGWFRKRDIAGATYKQLETTVWKKFKAAYEKVIEHVELSRVFDEPPEVIENIEEPALSREEGIERARNIKAMFEDSGEETT